MSRTGRESVLDLTLVSNNIAPVCDWEVHRGGTIGRDHAVYVKSI